MLHAQRQLHGLRAKQMAETSWIGALHGLGVVAGVSLTARLGVVGLLLLLIIAVCSPIGLTQWLSAAVPTRSRLRSRRAVWVIACRPAPPRPGSTAPMFTAATTLDIAQARVNAA